MTSETTGAATTTYLYDANGALTKSDDGTTVNAYTYDYDGYQTAFDTTGTSNDGTYVYDADKRRINKVVDSVTTKYFLDGANVIADYDVDDALVATYVTHGLDNNVSQTRSGSTYYYMKDGLGSIRNVVDSSEAAQNTYDYYAFGKELGTWTQNVTNRYTYTAREYDSEAKQYYYRARYYPSSGRFGRRDPARSSIDIYAYGLNRPAVFVDPLGLTEQWLTFTVPIFVYADSDGEYEPDFLMADSILRKCCIRPVIGMVKIIQSLAVLGGDTTLNTAVKGGSYNTEWDNMAALVPPNMITAHYVETIGGDLYVDGTGTKTKWRRIQGQCVKVTSATGIVGDCDNPTVAGDPLIAVANNRKSDTLAHELVHALGLSDMKDDERPGNLMFTGRKGKGNTSSDQCFKMRQSKYLKPTKGPVSFGD